MAANTYGVDDLVYSVTLYRSRRLLFHGYVGPFVIFYLIWFYIWSTRYGVSEYFEAGMIALAIIGIVQVLTCLFCHWSVHIRCLLSCNKVSPISYILFWTRFVLPLIVIQNQLLVDLMCSFDLKVANILFKS